MTKPAAEETLVITRVFAAPRELVFAAWTDPQHVVRWWGPKGFTASYCSIDLRVGGRFHFCMRSPDGKDYWNQGEYLELTSPERIVSVMCFSDAAGNPRLPTDYGLGADFPAEMHDVMTFEALGPRSTRFTLRRATPISISRSHGEEQGWNQSLDRFAAMLGEVTSPGMPEREIVLTRLIAAPRELVFKAWTEPEHVKRWWGPDGFTLTIHEMDLRVGGSWRFVMHGPDGTDYKNEHVYREIARPERLVLDHVSGPLFRMTATFAERGGGARGGFSPLETNSSQGGGADNATAPGGGSSSLATEVTVRMLFNTAEEREQTVKRFGAVEGLAQTLRRLETHVAASKP